MPTTEDITDVMDQLLGTRKSSGRPTGARQDLTLDETNFQIAGLEEPVRSFSVLIASMILQRIIERNIGCLVGGGTPRNWVRKKDPMRT